MTERLFVAVVPPDEVRERLDEFLEPRRDAGRSLRWVLPEAWHLTCAFLGSVRPDQVPRLEDALAGVAARTAPFGVCVAGCGAFPNPDAAKVLWLGLTEGATQLEALALRCRNAATTIGIEVAGGNFRPHLSIARANGIRARRWLEVLATIEPQAWPVAGFSLIRSRSLPGGAGYTTLAEYHLAGG